MGLEVKITAGTFFYQESTIGTIIAAIEANNETYCLQKSNRKVSAEIFQRHESTPVVNKEELQRKIMVYIVFELIH